MAERIFASRLEAFDAMLRTVARKMDIEEVTSDVLHLDELWTRFFQKTGWQGNEYVGYVRSVEAAGLVYSHGEGKHSLEKTYSVEELTGLSEQLLKLMMCIDLYAQLHGIKYTNLK